MKKQLLTKAQQAECRALKAIWEAKKKALNLTQQSLADAIGDGITQGAIGHYLHGRNALNLKFAIAIAGVLQVSIGDFSPRLAAEISQVSDLRSPYKAPSKSKADAVVSVTHKALPLSATIHGKHIHEGEDETQEPMYYQASWIKKMGFKPECLVVRQVKGSSMEPALYNGDSILINCDSRKPIHSRAFWVNVEGEACVKRVLKLHGQWWISSDNPAHKVRDIQLESPDQIMGEVVVKSSSHI